MIRRVGDHEQFSALRASELGDGTLEAREVEDCLKYVDLFLKPDLLTQMNECIMKNNEIGIYDGCKNVSCECCYYWVCSNLVNVFVSNNPAIVRSLDSSGCPYGIGTC